MHKLSKVLPQCYDGISGRQLAPCVLLRCCESSLHSTFYAALPYSGGTSQNLRYKFALFKVIKNRHNSIIILKE